MPITTLPTEVQAMVEQEMEDGQYSSEEEVLMAAMRAFVGRRKTRKTAEQKTATQRSTLGKRLRAIRRRYVEAGGKLLTVEELDREVAERRGERSSQE